MGHTDIGRRIDVMTAALRAAAVEHQGDTQAVDRASLIAQIEYVVGHVPRWVRDLPINGTANKRIAEWLRTLPAPEAELALFDLRTFHHRPRGYTAVIQSDRSRRR